MQTTGFGSPLPAHALPFSLLVQTPADPTNLTLPSLLLRPAPLIDAQELSFPLSHTISYGDRLKITFHHFLLASSTSVSFQVIVSLF